jgi:hypothetical protein
MKGEPCSKIAIRFGLYHAALAKKLKALLGISGGLPNFRDGYHLRMGCSLDELVFDCITEESAYWAGFLMADGCVHKGNVSMGLQERDVSHVESFRSFLKSTHAISRHPGQGMSTSAIVSFTVKSNRIAHALAGFGVVPRKTHIAEVKRLEKDKHFWRGVIDGDGTVTLIQWRTGRTSPLVILCGASTSLLQQFADFVRGVVPGAVANVTRSHSCYNVRISGTKAIELIRHLYVGATVYLERKYATAAKILAEAASDPMWCRRKPPGHVGPFSADHVHAMRLARIGKGQTPESNRKRSETQRGRKRSPETTLKIKATWAKKRTGFHEVKMNYGTMTVEQLRDEMARLNAIDLGKMSSTEQVDHRRKVEIVGRYLQAHANKRPPVVLESVKRTVPGLPPSA